MTQELHVYRYGAAGPVQVLAIHGLTGHGKRWQTLATRHLSDVAVAAPDLLGHGRSSWAAPWTIDANVAALAGCWTRTRADRVVVVGHSFGGAIALHLAAARPDLVESSRAARPAIGLDGEWMREIADEMSPPPTTPTAAEARAEKVNGSWGDVTAEDLEPSSTSIWSPLPNGRVGWRVEHSGDDVATGASLPGRSSLPPPEFPTTLLRATRTEPPYVVPRAGGRFARNARTPTSISSTSTAITWCRWRNPVADGGRHPLTGWR